MNYIVPTEFKLYLLRTPLINAYFLECGNKTRTNYEKETCMMRLLEESVKLGIQI